MEFFLSVVIPTCNREKILSQTIKHLNSSNVVIPEKTEFIIVNDGHRELNSGSFKIKNYPIHIIENRKQSLASARNAGVLNSKGQVICFLDDDILVPPNFFIEVIKWHKKMDKIIFWTKREYPSSIIQLAKSYSFGRYKLKWEYTTDPLKYGKTAIEKGVYLVNAVAGFSMSLKREAFEDIGYFNEEFSYAGCEDAEFSYRAIKKGYKIVYNENLICYHNEFDAFNLEGWLRRQSTGIKSAVVMCYLHPEGKKHPTFYTNTPISINDGLFLILHKLKKWILRKKLIYNFLLLLGRKLENKKNPLWDLVAFKIYNALFLGAISKYFLEEYKKRFGNK